MNTKKKDVKTNLRKELSKICPFTGHFKKEHEAFCLIKNSLESLKKKDELLNVKLEVLKFWHLFQLKNFFLRMGKQVAIENEVIDLNKNTIVDMMIDDLLWRIPELKNLKGSNKNKYNAAKFFINDKENREPKKLNNKHLEHPVPRTVLKRYLELKSVEVSIFDNNIDKINECAITIDPIMKLNFTVSMNKFHDSKLINQYRFKSDRIYNFNTSRKKIQDLDEINELMEKFKQDPFWRYEDLRENFKLQYRDNQCAWDYNVEEDILGIDKLKIGENEYKWENGVWT